MTSKISYFYRNSNPGSSSR